jgi:hypothetical protein
VINEQEKIYQNQVPVSMISLEENLNLKPRKAEIKNKNSTKLIIQEATLPER